MLGPAETDNIQEQALVMLLYKDTLNQFLQLQMLESHMMLPHMMERQLLAQLSPATGAYLISKYYEFDDLVGRELLGRKLTTRARKDLDVLAEATSVNIESCRRQFENIRSLFVCLYEKNFEVNITNMIV